MAADMVEYVYLETHRWPESLAFWQRLGFRLTLDLGRSGRLEASAGGQQFSWKKSPRANRWPPRCTCAPPGSSTPDPAWRWFAPGTTATGGRA